MIRWEPTWLFAVLLLVIAVQAGCREETTADEEFATDPVEFLPLTVGGGPVAGDVTILESDFYEVPGIAAIDYFVNLDTPNTASTFPPDLPTVYAYWDPSIYAWIAGPGLFFIVESDGTYDKLYLEVYGQEGMPVDKGETIDYLIEIYEF